MKTEAGFTVSLVMAGLKIQSRQARCARATSAQQVRTLPPSSNFKRAPGRPLGQRQFYHEQPEGPMGVVSLFNTFSLVIPRPAPFLK